MEPSARAARLASAVCRSCVCRVPLRRTAAHCLHLRVSRARMARHDFAAAEAALFVRIGREIGRGGFAIVYTATVEPGPSQWPLSRIHRSSTRSVAVKVVDCTRHPNGTRYTQEQFHTAQAGCRQERAIMEHLQAEGVPGLVGVHQQHLEYDREHVCGLCRPADAAAEPLGAVSWFLSCAYALCVRGCRSFAADLLQCKSYKLGRAIGS